VTFLPLTLGVRQKSDAENGASKSSSQPNKSQIDKTLRRDDFTCRFCGFRSENYQRVVAATDHGKDIGLVTTCTFCEQCVHLDRAGMMASGVLIWLPEIAQAELNHIARAIYVGRTGDGPIVELSTRAFDALMARRAEAKKRLGSDDPLLLATVLHESLTDDEAKSAIPKLDGVRLMPLDKHMTRSPKGDVNQFPQLVKYWCSPQGPYSQKAPEKWLEMLKTATAAVGHA
jgi:intracellular multiplication protein IcmJ